MTFYQYVYAIIIGRAISQLADIHPRTEPNVFLPIQGLYATLYSCAPWKLI